MVPVDWFYSVGMFITVPRIVSLVTRESANNLLGNGIQQAFYQDPNVLYISLHVHEDGNFYPSGNYGDHMHCGGGAGLGK